jgi:hypothetical protein
MTSPINPPRRRPAPAQPYHWFQGASVRELVDRLNAAGPDTARLEVRTVGDKMFFRVKPTGLTTTALAADIDDSRVCPPICG